MNDLLMKDIVKELRNKRMSDEEISNREIAARDRVDISLEKYEKMRDTINEAHEDIKEWKKKTEYLENLIKKFGMVELDFYNIDPENIVISKCEDALLSYPKQTKYRIEFTVREKV